MASPGREFLHSSPVRLIVLALVSTALCLAAGAVTARTSAVRQDSLRTLLQQTEPLADSTQQLYIALSIADASAGSAFISGGLEPRETRDRYLQAIGQAAADAAQGAAGPDDPAAIRELQRIVATELPVYAGLVETARANNRSGNPVGVAYLAEASTLMQQTILPPARQLHEVRAATVRTDADRQLRPPVGTIVLLVGAVLVLIAAQVYLARRWRRVFNPGLIVATALLVGLLGWLAVAGTLSATAAQHAVDEGTTPFGVLTTGRIYAQHARSDETLKIVRRDLSADYDADFATDIDALTELLTNYPDGPGADTVRRAREAQDRWLAAHARMNDAIATGAVDAATLAAIQRSYVDSTTEQAAVDSALTAGIDETRGHARDYLDAAARRLQLLPLGALGLGAGAAIAAGAGLRSRLREYR